MAKHRFTYSCGCDQTYHIGGKLYERKRKIERIAQRMQSQVCFACTCKAENELAAKSTTEMPALEGSEKQIAWATTIRFKTSERIAAAISHLETRRPNIEENLLWIDVVDAMEKFRAETLSSTSAKWWIDHRDLPDAVTSISFAKAVLEPLIAQSQAA